MEVYSDGLIHRLQSSIKDSLYSVYGDKSKVRDIYNYLNSIIHEPFSYFQGKMLDSLDPNRTMSFEERNSLIHDYEVYWDFSNALTFCCDLSKNKFNTDKANKDNIISLLDKLLSNFDTECVVINGRKDGFKPFIVRLSKSNFELGMKKKGVLHNTYCFTLSIQNEYGKDMSMSAYLVPELYPKMFIDSDYTKMLDKSSYNQVREGCIPVDMIMRGHISDGVDTRSLIEMLVENKEAMNTMFDIFRGEDEFERVVDTQNFLLLPYGVRNNDKYSGEILRNTGLYFDELLNMSIYCIDKYVNRKRVYKKNNESNTDCGVSTKVYIPKEDGSECKFVSLKDMVVYERTHKVSLGGHHASPREHTRRGYWRHYKSGKKVWINATTVNKGKRASTIYEV